MSKSEILNVTLWLLGVAVTFLLSPSWGWAFLLAGLAFLFVYFRMGREQAPLQLSIGESLQPITTAARPRPRLYISRYGREPGYVAQPRTGFWLKNDGPTAFNVTIDDIPLDSIYVANFKKIEALGTEPAFMTFGVGKGSPVRGSIDPNLEERLDRLCQERQQIKLAIPIIVRYRDHDGHAYKDGHKLRYHSINKKLTIEKD